MIVVLAVCKTPNLTSINKGGSQEPPFFITDWRKNSLSAQRASDTDLKCKKAYPFTSSLTLRIGFSEFRSD